LTGDADAIASTESIAGNALATQTVNITLHLDPPDLALSVAVRDPQCDGRMRVSPNDARQFADDFMDVSGKLSV
jgi:hypothetical protein